MIRTKEAQVEVLINRRLENLTWNLDHTHPSYNVAKQNVKTQEEKDALDGKVPDYVLYDQNNKPLAIIEAKKPHENLEKAIQQGIGYATRLKAPIVFATDGIFTKSYHVKYKKPLYLNKEELDDLIPQAIAIEYTDKNEHLTEDENVIKSKNELIPIFKRLNNNFKEAGIPAGRPRIELFCNFLFLKLISELSGQENSIIKSIPTWATWKNFTKKHRGEELFRFINKTAYNHFKESYGGEVLSPIKINAGKYDVLDNIVDSLESLVLHSIDTDIKGDAFEFFLRNYGGADTDFGEYFTPRHIVKALVKILNPQIGEKVYDPFCGTGGMLTYSYKHIYNLMARTPKNIKDLKAATVYGGELTDMSRVAKMNMILAGDGHSNILQQDSYATPQRGKHDVVITNMPFGSKMKTPYAKQYGYNTSKAEIVGVLHCLDALSNHENARAGILVPEGILFNSTKAYTSLREQLTEQYTLENIISLPGGVFGKNTGVKSNILIIKKHPTKKKNHIWYFKVQNDGFTLDAHRRKIAGTNDIDIISLEKDLCIEDSTRLKKLGFSMLYKDKIKSNNYILLPGQYQKFEFHTKHEMVKLGDVFLEIKNGKNVNQSKDEARYKVTRIETISNGFVDLKKIGYTNDDITENHFMQYGDILLSHINSSKHLGKSAFFKYKNEKVVHGVNLIRLRPNKSVINPLYASYLFKSSFFINAVKQFEKKAINQSSVSITDVKSIQIPLPPLETQKAIVEELESYQTIIQSAQKIMASWKPFFQVDGSWEVVKLRDVADFIRGITFSKKDYINKKENDYLGIVTTKSAQKKGIDYNSLRYIKSEKVKSGKLLQVSDILMSIANSLNLVGRTTFIDKLEQSLSFGAFMLCVRAKENILPKYLYACLNTESAKKYYLSRANTTTNISNLNPTKLDIYLPPLEVQQKIVAELEAERALIEAQKEVIATFEYKMQSTLNTLWQK